MKRILLAGYGNIGSRHLQALAKLQGTVNVDIVENSSHSILISKTRLGEIKKEKVKPCPIT